MADEGDVANDHIEQELALRIHAARQIKAVPENTDCLNCGEPLIAGGRYCCAGCKDDAELRDRQRRRSGTA